MAENDFLKSPEKKSINIRTMQSDISEFLKDTKPSLVQLITAQVEAERASPFQQKTRWVKDTKKPLVIGGAVFIVLVVAAAGILGYRLLRAPSAPKFQTIIPRSFFSTDNSITLDASENPVSLPQKLKDLAPAAGNANAITRLIILVPGENQIRGVTSQEFLSGLQTTLPQNIMSTFTDPAMPVYVQTSHGVRFSVVMKTADPSRTLAGFLQNESSLRDMLLPLFLGGSPLAPDVSFSDANFKNIGYRVLRFDSANGVELVYGLFPANNYFIVATSEEAFKTIITRLFQSS